METGMEIDQSIASLAEKLDAWFDSNATTFASADRTAHVRALDRGVATARELDGLKASALKVLKSLIAHSTSAPDDDERTASLIKAFEVGAKLRAALYDELLDVNGYNKIVLLMNDIAAALDTTPQGRSVLGELLDHSDSCVRAAAGSYLLITDLLPERVVPVLREIEQTEGATTAYFTAYRALLDWELRHKSASIDGGKQKA
jgi:hypothetical protein